MQDPPTIKMRCVQPAHGGDYSMGTPTSSIIVNNIRNIIRMIAPYTGINMIKIRNIDDPPSECYTACCMASETRATILRTMRTRGHCTVKDLADAAGISPVSVRHHLSSLQAESLIELEEVRHGVGRPHHVFSLTEEAHELFPTRYFRLTNRLLGEIKDLMPVGSVEGLLTGIADSMASDYAGQLKDLPIEKRLNRLVELLDEEGFDAQVERRGDEVVIRELTCPYYQIGQAHPEVCMIDQTFIAQALSLPVERVRCVLDGDAHCAFSVPLGGTKS
jgi:DeoR family suf operon transcriptional repressor